MANLVIVSAHCYLLCEAINYISVDLCRNQDIFDEDGDIKYDTLAKKAGGNKKGRRLTKKEKEALVRGQLLYNVSINFVPVSGNGSNSRPEQREVEITVQGYDATMKFYKQLVSQIREQLPDQKFLDDMVERLLSGEEPKDD